MLKQLSLFDWSLQEAQGYPSCVFLPHQSIKRNELPVCPSNPESTSFV